MRTQVDRREAGSLRGRVGGNHFAEIRKSLLAHKRDNRPPVRVYLTDGKDDPLPRVLDDIAEGSGQGYRTVFVLNRYGYQAKGEDYQRYRGATLLTPNRAEFRQVAGSWRSEADLASRAQRLRAELGISALLVTRAEEGMSLFTDAGSLNFSAEAREVYDVSGAGDTVIATLGALLGAHADLASAVRIANQAAGIVVGKLGTAVVHPDELA